VLLTTGDACGDAFFWAATDDGEGSIALDPLPRGPDRDSCGTVSGTLELTGLEAEDGTTFAPIRVTSDSIGCYAG